MKKEKTIKQQKNHDRAVQYSLFVGEFAVLPVPYAIMCAVNHEEWFVDNPDSWKIGLGGAIAIALMAITVFLVGKKKENKELTGGYIALILGWYAFAFVALLLAQILTEIYKIMFIGGTGMIAGFGLDVASKKFKKRADKHKKNIEIAEDKLEQEQAKEEMVKVRIK